MPRCCQWVVLISQCTELKMLRPPIPCSGSRLNASGFDVQPEWVFCRELPLRIPYLESKRLLFIYFLWDFFSVTFSKSQVFYFWSTVKCRRDSLRWDWAARSASRSVYMCVWSVFGFEVQCRSVNSNQDSDRYCSTEGIECTPYLTSSAPPIMFSSCNLQVKKVDEYLCSQCWVCLMVTWLGKLCVRERETQRRREAIMENAVWKKLIT